jgi:hypothetical protein
VITNLNKNGIIPARIDKTVLAGQSGGMQSYLWGALRFFDLIDESKVPTEELKSLARAEGEDRKKIWRRIFDRAYQPIIGDLDLATATLGMLHDRFAAQDLTGETVRKCHSFYAAAAADAGIALPPQLESNKRLSGPRKTRTKSGKAATETDDGFAIENEKTDGNNGKEKTRVYTLPLENGRSFQAKAPDTVTKNELERIKNWLSFQLIVTEEK